MYLSLENAVTPSHINWLTWSMSMGRVSVHVVHVPTCARGKVKPLDPLEEQQMKLAWHDLGFLSALSFQILKLLGNFKLLLEFHQHSQPPHFSLRCNLETNNV